MTTALIKLEDLAARRFADPTPALIKRLKYLARRGQLPGARKLGSLWYCNLSEFDKPANDGPAPPPAPSLADLVARARAERSAQ